MSRTRKGAKGPGSEFDRKREGKSGYTSTGPFAKKMAHKAGRKMDKKAIRTEAE